MVFKLTTTQFYALQTLRNGFPTIPTLNNNYDYGLLYEKVLEYIELYEQTNTLSEDELRTKLWIEGALGVNRNTTAESLFIRNYNNLQAQWRYGETVSNAQMNQVSDEIVVRVIDNILLNNGIPLTSDLPLIRRIAEHDAEPAATRLFHNDETPGGWAGNPLFLFLGYDTAFKNNIIGEAGNAYDLLAMLKGLNINFFSTNFYSQFINATGVTYSAGSASIVAGAVADAANFLDEVYGDNATLLNAATFSDIRIGREGNINDTLFATGSSEYIHGHGGNDRIVGSLQPGLVTWDRDIVDGGDGSDELDFTNITNGINVVSDVQGYTGFNLELDRIDNVGSTTYAYNIEHLKLGSGDDEVEIDLTSGATLERLDTNNGDDEVVIKLNVPNGPLKQVNTGNGDDEVNILGAHDVNLTIDLGAGDDKLAGAVAGSRVYGGAGDDVFRHGKDYMIMDADEGDRIYYHGFRLTGGTRSASSESEWVYGKFGERYALNVAGELVIRDKSGRDTYIADFKREGGTPGGGAPMAGLTVAEISLEFYRLLELPSSFFWGLYGAFEAIMGTYLKAMTGISGFPGVDPLVLDLDGDGIELSSRSSISPYFDLDADGFAEKTGWVRGDDGFLAANDNYANESRMVA